MKNKLFLLLILLPIISYAQWTGKGSGIEPYENFQIINGISVVSENTVWAISFPADFTVIPAFTRTTNGGETWESGTIVTDDPTLNPTSIYARDSLTAWVGMSNFPDQAYGKVFKTIDGGVTWQDQPIFTTLGTTFYFWSDLEGMATGAGNLTDGSLEFFRTEDGGLTWQPILDIGLESGEVNWVINTNHHYEIVGDNVWTGTARGRIVKSSDRGKTYRVIDPNIEENSALNSIAFQDELNGITISSATSNGAPKNTTGYRTMDGGETWAPIDIPSNMLTIDHIPNSGGVYMGTLGAAGNPDFLLSFDGGETWETLSSPPLITTQFLSPSVGWAGSAIEAGGLYKWEGEPLRSRSNELWNKVASNIIPEGHLANDVEMTEDGTVWITSSIPNPAIVETTILKSNDGGLTWEQLPLPELPDHDVVDISLVNASIAFVTMVDAFANGAIDENVGPIDDAIFKTIDGGMTWTKLDSYPYNPFYVHFFNENEGWVMGENDDFLEFDDIIMSVTSDGGLTWSHAGGADWSIPMDRSLPERDTTNILGLPIYSTTGNYTVMGDNILIGGLNNYWLSKDKGHNWESFISPLFENNGLRTTAVGMKDVSTFMLATNFDSTFFFTSPKAYTTIDGGSTWIESDPTITPSNIHYLPGTEQSFIINGDNSRFEETGLIGTTRTDDLLTWEIVDTKPIIAADFIGENQGIGVFGNFINAGETGNIYAWGELMLPAYAAAVARQNEYTYTVVTLNHIEEVVYQYQIESTGLNELTNTTFHFEVLLDDQIVSIDSVLVEAVVDNGSTVMFSYLPDQVGLYEFNIYASQENIGAQFFKDSRLLEVSETTLSKDDNSPENIFGFDPDNFVNYGFLGSEFNLLVDDVLESFSILVAPFPDVTDPDAEFTFIIKKINENGEVEEGEVYTSPAIVAATTFTPDASAFTYQLPEPVSLEAGSYIFAVGQDAPQKKIAFGADGDRDNDGWWEYSVIELNEIGVVWEKVVEGFLPTLMLRPIFQGVSTSTIEEILAQTIPLQVFPVPFSQRLNIQLDYPEESKAHIQLFDLTGKLWTERTVDHNHLISQNFNDIPNGMYLLKIRSGQYMRTVKVLKQ